MYKTVHMRLSLTQLLWFMGSLFLPFSAIQTRIMHNLPNVQCTRWFKKKMAEDMSMSYQH